MEFLARFDYTALAASTWLTLSPAIPTWPLSPRHSLPLTHLAARPLCTASMQLLNGMWVKPADSTVLYVPKDLIAEHHQPQNGWPQCWAHTALAAPAFLLAWRVCLCAPLCSCQVNKASNLKLVGCSRHCRSQPVHSRGVPPPWHPAGSHHCLPPSV